jgi:hypothetical protein
VQIGHLALKAYILYVQVSICFRAKNTKITIEDGMKSYDLVKDGNLNTINSITFNVLLGKILKMFFILPIRKDDIKETIQTFFRIILHTTSMQNCKFKTTI